MQKIVVVTGPTASGKSAYGLALARALGGEIVSADSMQVYRHLDVGTAKPTPEERRLVPHHLIDVADVDEVYHVGRFREEAARAIDAVAGRGAVPVVVGGTALYLKVLLHGLAEAPPRSDEVRRRLEARWEAGEGASLWGELREADPVLAGRLHPNDRARIVRGLEVLLVSGRRLSEVQQRHGFGEQPYEALRLGMEVARSELRRRIDARVLGMLEQGWVEEVRRVLALGYGSVPALQAIGYRQLCAWLRQGGELSAVIGEIQAETRRFSKRQMTWFRQMDLRWVDPGDPGEGIRLARKFLQ